MIAFTASEVEAVVREFERRPEPIPLRAKPKPLPPDLVETCDGCGLTAPCWFVGAGALYCFACREFERGLPPQGAA